MNRVRLARLRAWGALALLAAGLAGCSSLPQAQAPAQAQRYAGRFSLSVLREPLGAEPQRENWNGRFTLAVSDHALSLDLVSPLGATLARVEREPGDARLLVPRNGGVQVEHGPDAQALSERVLGWSLPLDGMPDWIAGGPAPARPFRTLESAAGAPVRFEQDGWTVTVEAPQDGRGRRVQMDRAARDDSPEMALRVVLDAP